MNNIRKLLIGVVVALVIAGAFTAIVYKKIQTGKIDAIKQTRTWKYVASTREIAAGERVTAEMITMVDWSSNLPVDGAMDAPEKAIGRVVSFPCRVGWSSPTRCLHHRTLRSDSRPRFLMACARLPSKQTRSLISTDSCSPDRM